MVVTLTKTQSWAAGPVYRGFRRASFHATLNTPTRNTKLAQAVQSAMSTVCSVGVMLPAFPG